MVTRGQWRRSNGPTELRATRRGAEAQVVGGGVQGGDSGGQAAYWWSYERPTGSAVGCPVGGAQLQVELGERELRTVRTIAVADERQAGAGCRFAGPRLIPFPSICFVNHIHNGESLGFKSDDAMVGVRSVARCFGIKELL